MMAADLRSYEFSIPIPRVRPLRILRARRQMARKLKLSRRRELKFALKSDERKLPETTLEGPTGKYRT
jgi:hypothetical protein